MLSLALNCSALSRNTDLVSDYSALKTLLNFRHPGSPPAFVATTQGRRRSRSRNFSPSIQERLAAILAHCVEVFFVAVIALDPDRPRHHPILQNRVLLSSRQAAQKPLPSVRRLVTGSSSMHL
jgi:hypothetical protein